MPQPTTIKRLLRLPLWGATVFALAIGAALYPSAAVGQTTNSAASELAAKDEVTATWVGFRRTGPKSALVYVQLTDVTTVETTKAKLSITVTLKKTRVQIKNNRNPLLTSHFDSAVESARLIPSGKDLALVIQLKRDAEVNARVDKESQGAVLLVELTEP